MKFVELVPRDLDLLLDDAKTVMTKYPFLTGINIPDVPRLSNRSYDACAHLLDNGINSLPHIRTIDCSLDKTLEIITSLVKKNLKQVLFITGDPPKDNTIPTYQVTPEMATASVKKLFPDLNVYCGVDPYRQSFDDEMTYVRKKLDAGADGLFSQPFFDIPLTIKFLEACKNTQLFVGLSPVTSEKSKIYWENQNKVTFSTTFKPTLEYNCSLGKEIIEITERYNQHLYLMPIKTPIMPYLSGLFNYNLQKSI